MAKLKLLFDILLMITVFVLAVAFIYRNGELVTVDLLVTKISSLHLGWWLLLSFSLGGLLGLFARLPSTLSLKMKLRYDERKLQRQEEELNRLRREPAKGS